MNFGSLPYQIDSCLSMRNAANSFSGRALRVPIQIRGDEKKRPEAACGSGRFSAFRPRSPREGSALFEVGGTTLGSFALLALGDILDLAVLEERLHLDFAAAGAEEFLRRAGRTAVLTGLSHDTFSRRAHAACTLDCGPRYGPPLRIKYNAARSTVNRASLMVLRKGIAFLYGNL